MTPAGQVLQRIPEGRSQRRSRRVPAAGSGSSGTGSDRLYGSTPSRRPPPPTPCHARRLRSPSPSSRAATGRCTSRRPTTAPAWPRTARATSTTTARARPRPCPATARCSTSRSRVASSSPPARAVTRSAGSPSTRWRRRPSPPCRWKRPDGVAVDGSGRIWVTLYVGGTVAHFPGEPERRSRDRAARGRPGQPVRHHRRRRRSHVRRGAGVGRDRPDRPRDERADALRRAGRAAVPDRRRSRRRPLRHRHRHRRILRFVNSPPRATTGAARALATTAGSVDAKVDARGNETQVVFDYGTTTAYGSTTAPLTVAQGVGDTDVRADLPPAPAGHDLPRARAGDERRGLGHGRRHGVHYAQAGPDPRPRDGRLPLGLHQHLHRPHEGARARGHEAGHDQAHLQGTRLRHQGAGPSRAGRGR